MAAMARYKESGRGLLIPDEPQIACTMCGREYPVKHRGSFQQHVESCYQEHEEALQQEALEHSKPILDHDTELQDWVRKKGQQNGKA